MTENQKELVRLILENDNPNQAVMTLAAIIEFLKHHETFEEQSSVFLQNSCQTNP